MFSKKNIRILTVTAVFLPSILFFNVAHASTFTDSVSNILSFINDNIIGLVKKDFCNNYSLYVSSGDWKVGELRTNLGRKICTSENTNVSNIEIPNASSVNNPRPDVYIPNSIAVNASLDNDKIISLTNQQRKINDSTLVNLNKNDILTNLAKIRVDDMFAKQYFEHISPTGDNVSKEAEINGYTYITIGENIALGNFDGSSGLVTAWMNSPGHRENILNKNYTEIGVFARQGKYNGNNVWIAAQIFGRPLSDCTEPNAVLKNNISQYELSVGELLTQINNIDNELKTFGQFDRLIYNSNLSKRNNLAGQYNNLNSQIKILVEAYNKEVSTFNLCIKTL